MHDLSAARILRLYDWPGGRLLAQARLGPFVARAGGSAASDLIERVPVDAVPTWAELVDGEHRVLFVGPVGDEC